MSITAHTGYSASTKGDPYTYQVGFGNHFASESLDGVLPIGQNTPQRLKYDLYPEGISGTAFTTPRAHNQRTWFYRIQPSVSHNGFDTTEVAKNDLESDFAPSNPKVHVSPTQVAWKPFILPSGNEQIDFIQGLKPLEETANKAFVNSDGDFLIIPQEGRLDIQTELGKLMVKPGEIIVIQAGLKFKVSLPDGPSRGYIHEVFGVHYELPELGPLGANGMANVRDFEHPVAGFDVDQSDWEVVYKLGGQLFTCRQDHTPFDVVAWHGNYVPYKYDLNKFTIAGNLNKDHSDPSVFCVLMAKSKMPGRSLTEFCVVGPRWDVAEGTFRPPYFHRNTAGELLGVIMGERSTPGFEPGGMNYRPGFCPHGVGDEVFKAAIEAELVPKKIGEGSLVFLIEPADLIMLTDFALNKNNGFDVMDVSPWKGLGPNFLKHIPDINAQLKAAGRAEISVSAKA
ncbi:hypothetical protein QCA50_006092 [Cerrena zonata]|uniref:homogentisate 1,2-dioxygenase n=1 Tax=Cerrena zonata TaxID=2478898 RepID=A0AAW0GGW6_9APHY